MSLRLHDLSVPKDTGQFRFFSPYPTQPRRFGARTREAKIRGKRAGACAKSGPFVSVFDRKGSGPVAARTRPSSWLFPATKGTRPRLPQDSPHQNLNGHIIIPLMHKKEIL